jgi:long-subunit fatty acid transport protein
MRKVVELFWGIFVLCAFGSSGAAIAGEDNGVYIYGASGQSIFSQGLDNPQAYMLLLGYQFNQKWSIEGGYTDIGQISNYAKDTATSLTAVRTWNVSDIQGKSALSVLVKFGFAQVKTEYDAAIMTPPSYTKRGATFGIGAKYDFDESWSLRVDADSFDTGRIDLGRVPVYSLGLSYMF